MLQLGKVFPVTAGFSVVRTCFFGRLGFADLLQAEPLDLQHVMLAPFLLILSIELFFDSFDEAVKEAEQHHEKTHVGEVALAVGSCEDVLKEDTYLHFTI